MDNLLIFFAIPLAVIILSSILESFINCPIKVAGIFFSIFIVLAFALGETAELIVAAIVYTVISFITAIIIRYIINRRCNCNFDFSNNCNCFNNSCNSCNYSNNTSNINSDFNLNNLNYLNNTNNVGRIGNGFNEESSVNTLSSDTMSNTRSMGNNCRRYRY